jgi:hypothetical protein
MPSRIVRATLLGIAERRTGQQVELPHLRPDQTLDMATKSRLSWRSPFDRDARILASSLEGSAVEVGAIVDVQSVGQTRDGLPSFFVHDEDVGSGMVDLNRFQRS